MHFTALYYFGLLSYYVTVALVFNEKYPKNIYLV